MLTNRDIIFISSIEWGVLWQAHHEIASRLAAAGNRVLYVENIGVRAPGLRDGKRVLARVGAWSAAATRGGAREVAPRLWTTAPLLAPPFANPVAWRLNRSLLIPAVARTAKRLGFRDPVLWTYLPTDTALSLIEALATPSSPVLYSCLADFGRLTEKPEALAASEARLLQRADAVFALPGLLAHCGRARQLETFEPGVALEAFALETEPAPRLASLPRPVIGYTGGLHRHLDQDLLAEAARARPDWSWVLVGPAVEPVDRLRELPNVHLLGSVRHDELAGVLATFDVGMIPYHVTQYIESAVPTKLGEYLAMGLPVVSTPVPAVVKMAQRHDVVLTPPAGTRPFLDAIDRALEMRMRPGTATACRSIAEERAWGPKLAEMAAKLDSGATTAQAA